MVQGTAQTWENWTEENTTEKSLDDLIHHRDLAQASIEANEWPSLNENWRQDVADLDRLIAVRQQEGK